MTGIGIDIVSGGRVKDVWIRHGWRLRGDIFSESEWRALGLPETSDSVSSPNLSPEDVMRVGCLFAAKEAVFKLLETSAASSFDWLDIEITPGPPMSAQLHGPLAHVMCTGASGHLHVDVSATDHNCVAIAIGER